MTFRRRVSLAGSVCATNTTVFPNELYEIIQFSTHLMRVSWQKYVPIVYDVGGVVEKSTYRLWSMY